MNAYRFLVSMDTLWDTRIATVSHFDPDYAAKLLLAGYNDRKSDDFVKHSKKFSEEDYRRQYAQRNLQTTIRNATQTRMYGYIHDLITDEIKEQSLPSEMQRFVIHVNMYPYVLDQGYQMIVNDIVRSMIPLAEEVQCVNISPENLTPKFIGASDYKAIFMYDLTEWFNMHVDAIKDVRMPQRYIVGPYLLADVNWRDKLSKEELEQLEGWDAVTYLEYLSTEFLPVRFLPASWFSSIYATT